jgi:hypothetical protein
VLGHRMQRAEFSSRPGASAELGVAVVGVVAAAMPPSKKRKGCLEYSSLVARACGRASPMVGCVVAVACCCCSQ